MHVKITCYIFVLFAILAASVEYVPKSRKIEVIENGEYVFGFDETSSIEIANVSYRTDTGITGSFNVNHNSSGEDDKKILRGKDDVSNLGKVGLAQLRLRYASDTGPKVWTLTSKDLKPVDFTVSFFYKAPILIEEVSVVEGASFLQYITLPNKQWKMCVLRFGDVKIDLKVESSESYIFLPSFQESKTSISEKVHSLGRGLCGFRLANAITEMSKIDQWSLTATDNSDKLYRGTFKVVVSQKPNTMLVKKVIVGDYAIWSCGTETNEQNYCALYNPEGKLVQEGRTCSYRTDTVSIADLGNWKCVTGIRKSMETQDYTINVVDKGSDMIETWVKDYDKYIMLGCKMNGSPYESLTFCRMVAPNNKVFNLLPGSATDRYVSLGTNFSDSTCAIEIEKPLHADENGWWKCEMNAGSNDVTGGFLKVGEVKRPDYPRSIRITTQLKTKFTIFCEVPFSSEYCHIRAPNGTIYEPDSIYRTRLGHCSYTIEKSSITDNGIWFCSFAQEMGMPDEEIAVEVIIAEALLYYSEISVRSGDTAELMCSSGGLPFNYCRFVSPSGKGYYIHNHQSSKTISYKGKGLEYGECGISINNIQTSDSGMWACVTRLGIHYKQPEITARINLIVSPNFFEDPNLATAVGLSVGIVIVSAIAGIIVYRKWKQRRNNQQNSPQQRLINDGDSVTLGFSEVANHPVISQVQDSHEHQP